MEKRVKKLGGIEQTKDPDEKNVVKTVTHLRRFRRVVCSSRVHTTIRT